MDLLAEDGFYCAYGSGDFSEGCTFVAIANT